MASVNGEAKLVRTGEMKEAKKLRSLLFDTETSLTFTPLHILFMSLGFIFMVFTLHILVKIFPATTPVQILVAILVLLTSVHSNLEQENIYQMANRRKEFSSKEKSSITKKLSKNLGPEYIADRSGPGNQILTYVQGWVIVDLANKIFGFNGWSTKMKGFEQEYCDIMQDGRVNVGFSCRCRVTLRDGTYREDVGFGSSENLRQKGFAIQKAKKEAATDALKRALRLFGNALGNCLHNKTYLKDVRKVQNTKAVPFDPNALLTRNDLVLSPDCNSDNSISFDHDDIDLDTQE